MHAPDLSFSDGQTLWRATCVLGVVVMKRQPVFSLLLLLLFLCEVKKKSVTSVADVKTVRPGVVFSETCFWNGLQGYWMHASKTHAVPSFPLLQLTCSSVLLFEVTIKVKFRGLMFTSTSCGTHIWSNKNPDVCTITHQTFSFCLNCSFSSINFTINSPGTLLGYIGGNGTWWYC